jgi:GNAT superfamily N-acetyltransferase
VGEIDVRPYEPGDEAGVLELLKAALGETPLLKRTSAWFTWKHFDNPFGESIMLVATDHDRIVGLRAFMRWDLTTPDGARVRCVRAVDTATHPDYQRRGIFRRLTEAALDLARASGVDMVFNTPNPRSGAGYLKMGWQEVGDVGVMVAPSLRRMLSKGQAPSGDLAEMLVDAKPATALDVIDRPPRGLRTPRTPEYLEWRFSGNPNATYLSLSERGATAVLRANLRRGRPELVVSDVFGGELRTLLAAARRRSRAHYVVGWFPKGTRERRAAIAAGYLPVPGRKALRLVVRPLRELPVEVHRLENWDVTMGDLELL